jgi:hypothetical protein
VHELIPGPLAPSAHENDVVTNCPAGYVAPDAGELINADGAAATV